MEDRKPAEDRQKTQPEIDTKVRIFGAALVVIVIVTGVLFWSVMLMVVSSVKSKPSSSSGKLTPAEALFLEQTTRD